jgi:hypothetical protein
MVRPSFCHQLEKEDHMRYTIKFNPKDVTKGISGSQHVARTIHDLAISAVEKGAVPHLSPTYFTALFTNVLAATLKALGGATMIDLAASADFKRLRHLLDVGSNYYDTRGDLLASVFRSSGTMMGLIFGDLLSGTTSPLDLVNALGDYMSAAETIVDRVLAAESDAPDVEVVNPNHKGDVNDKIEAYLKKMSNS